MLTKRAPRSWTSQPMSLSRTERLNTGSPIAIRPMSLSLWASHTRYRSLRPYPLDTGIDQVSDAILNKLACQVPTMTRFSTGRIASGSTSHPEAKYLSSVGAFCERNFALAASRLHLCELCVARIRSLSLPVTSRVPWSDLRNPKVCRWCLTSRLRDASRASTSITACGLLFTLRTFAGSVGPRSDSKRRSAGSPAPPRRAPRCRCPAPAARR